MKKIVLVEDNADNRLLVQVILGDFYDIASYENGKDALEGIAAQKPDLILLDISLPKMDGNAILGIIRADETTRDVPVIALTAHAMAGDREKYLEAGFTDYVAKPIVDEEVLLSAIKRALAQ